MEISFKDLTKEDIGIIQAAYESDNSKKLVQTDLAERFGVTRRTIRNWANRLQLNVLAENINNPFKVLVYDLETSQIPAKVWSTGKTYIRHTQLRGETKIITASYKWLGQDEVTALTWSKSHSDEKLMRDLLKAYNSADMVIGFNNDKFDNKLVNTRAAKYGLEVNTLIKSYDVMKQAKKLFRLPSYSMAYMCKFFGVTLKQSHEGIIMWDMIEDGTKEQQAEYLPKMVDYNIGDIISTEELYLAIRKYMGHKVHVGVFKGQDKFTCPNCGTDEVNLFSLNPITTPAGTIQRHMVCSKDRTQFKISNLNYLKLLKHKNIL